MKSFVFIIMKQIIEKWFSYITAKCNNYLFMQNEAFKLICYYGRKMGEQETNEIQERLRYMHKLLGAFETNEGTVLQLRVDAIVRGAHHASGSRFLSSSERTAETLDLSNGDGTKDLDPSPRHRSSHRFPFLSPLFFSSSLDIRSVRRRTRTSLDYSPDCGRIT